MQLQGEAEDLGFCLSFDCYFSDSLTASAAAKAICELKQDQQAYSQFYKFSDLDEDDFEFSLDKEVSHDQHIDLIEHQQFVFPVSDSAVEETDDASPEYSSSSFSSGKGDIESRYECKPSGMFCLWSTLAKCKKISSAGSRSRGSRRWRVWKSLRWSNSEVEESVLVKKTDSLKERRRVNTLEVANVAGKVKTMMSSPSFHELFYLQKRVERKGDKMKSFLPYKQDLLARVFC